MPVLEKCWYLSKYIDFQFEKAANTKNPSSLEAINKKNITQSPKDGISIITK